MSLLCGQFTCRDEYHEWAYHFIRCGPWVLKLYSDVLSEVWVRSDPQTDYTPHSHLSGVWKSGWKIQLITFSEDFKGFASPKNQVSRDTYLQNCIINFLSSNCITIHNTFDAH